MTVSCSGSRDRPIIACLAFSLVFMISGCGSSEAIDPTIKIEQGPEAKDSIAKSGRIQKGVGAKVPQPEKRGTGSGSRE